MAADPVTASTVDDLLDYDFSDLDDPFAEKNANNTKNDAKTRRDDKAGPGGALSPTAAKRKLDEAKENLGLGIDKEVKIAKKRQPIAKLDEARLLSEPGIPRIRKLARSGKLAKKLGFKGKGHEFSDVARLLNYYQIWLDGLYPRAKFADGLQLIEKVGHSKRMNVIRKTWIDEGKPGYQAFNPQTEAEADPDSYPATHETSQKDKDDQDHGARDPDAMFFQDPTSHKAPANEGAPDEDDDLDALLAENSNKTSSETPPKPSQPAAMDDLDDLDALMAEYESGNAPASGLMLKQSSVVQQNAAGNEDEDEDDLDALLAEHESHKAQAERQEPTKVSKRTTMFDEDEEDDDEIDDLDALLAEQEAREKVQDGNQKNCTEEDDLDGEAS